MKKPIGINVVGWGLLILQIPILLYGLNGLLAFDLIPALAICTALLGGLLSIGILKGKNWARLLFLTFTAFYVLWDTFDFIREKEYLDRLSLVSSCSIYFFIFAVCLYLLSPKVVRYFK